MKNLHINYIFDLRFIHARLYLTYSYKIDILSRSYTVAYLSNLSVIDEYIYYSKKNSVECNSEIEKIHSENTIKNIILTLLLTKLANVF